MDSSKLNKKFSRETQKEYWRNYPEPIRNRMAELGLTLSSLSEQSEVPRMTLSGLLSGKTEPGIFAAKRVAYALRMSLERLTEILEEANHERALQQHTKSRIVNSLVTNGDCNSITKEKLLPAC